MSRTLEREIKDTITCNLCSDILNEPVTLPCLHTYCCGCLGELVVMETESKDTIECPECTKVHVVPTKGLEDFKISYTVKRLIEIFEAANVNDYKPQCNICESIHNVEAQAVISCTVCQKNMCRQCEKYHEEFLNTHTTFDLTGDRSQDMQRAIETVKDHDIHCESHKIPLQIYCKVDKCSVCPTCYVIDHSGHKCMDVHIAARANIQQINDLLRHGEKLLDHYDTAIEDIQKYQKEVENDVQGAKNDLKHDVEVAIEIIHEKYNRAIIEIDRTSDECQNQTAAYLGHLELQKSTIQTKMNRLRTMKDYGHDTELANSAVTIDIESKLKEWSKLPQLQCEQRSKLTVQREAFEIMFGKIDVECYYDAPQNNLSTRSCSW